MTALTIRAPFESDAAAIATIDAQGLATGHASFRETPHDWESFVASFMVGRGLALVAQNGDDIAGWCGVAPTSVRAVYQGVGEISVYVAPARQRQGIARHLMAKMIVASERAGYWTLVAQIFPENRASLLLHKGLGFQVVGTRRKLGQMGYGLLAGRWRDVTMLERRSPLIG
ncbi:MAG: N-acetyltransferase family protein [Pseudomonadota bacterium]